MRRAVLWALDVPDRGRRALNVGERVGDPARWRVGRVDAKDGTEDRIVAKPQPGGHGWPRANIPPLCSK